MLFLIALTLPLTFKEWKQVIWWITSLLWGIVDLRAYSNRYYCWKQLGRIGYFITIFLTAAFHLMEFFLIPSRTVSLINFWSSTWFRIWFLLPFIAQNDSFWWAWLPFNIGIELGQILIVVILLFVYSISQKIGVQLQMLRALITGVLLTLSTLMILERIPNELF